MSKSIQLRNNVYLCTNSIVFNRYWYLNELISGKYTYTTGANSNVWTKIVTIRLSSSYARNYCNIQLIDEENGMFISELFIYVRKGNDSQNMQILRCIQKKYYDPNSRIVPYVYITKNTSSIVEIELWTKSSSTWTTPFYFIRSSNLNNVNKSMTYQQNEPSGTKHEFTNVT